MKFDPIPTGELVLIFRALMQMLPAAWEAERRGALTADVASKEVTEPALIEFTTDIWRSVASGIRGEDQHVEVQTQMSPEQAESAIAALERLAAVVPPASATPAEDPCREAAHQTLTKFLATAKRALHRSRGAASLETGADDPPVV